MTTLRQKLVRKKNRKLRRLRELYPDIRIKLFYARDFRALMLKYGRLALADGAVRDVRPGRSRTVAPVELPAVDADPLVAAPAEIQRPTPTAGQPTTARPGRSAVRGATARPPAAAGAATSAAGAEREAGA